MKTKTKIDYFGAGVALLFGVIALYFFYRMGAVMHLRRHELVLAGVRDARREIVTILVLTMVVVFFSSRKLILSLTDPVSELTVVLRNIFDGREITASPTVVAEFGGFIDLFKANIQSMRINEKLFSLMSESMGEGMAIYRGTKLLKVNPMFDKMIGKDVTPGEDLLDWIASDSRDSFLQSEKLSAPFRSVLCNQDGVCLSVMARSRSIQLTDGPASMLLLTDLSAEMKIEEERQIIKQRIERSKKTSVLENIGIGIAYELGGPIGIIHGFAEILQEAVSHGGMTKDQATSGLTKIVRQSERVIAILQHLKQLHHELTFERRQLVDPRKLLKVSMLLFNEQFKDRGIVLKTVIDENLGSFWCYLVKIEIALQYIIKNAVEALDSVERPQKYIEFGMHQAEQNALRIDIGDNGPGILSEHDAILCEPFFTTKDQSKHAGLGLAITQVILQEEGCKLRWDSEPGSGAVFSVVIPMDPRSKERRS